MGPNNNNWGPIGDWKPTRGSKLLNAHLGIGWFHFRTLNLIEGHHYYFPNAEQLDDLICNKESSAAYLSDVEYRDHLPNQQLCFDKIRLHDSKPSADRGLETKFRVRVYNQLRL
jgi:hypothetical protein